MQPNVELTALTPGRATTSRDDLVAGRPKNPSTLVNSVSMLASDDSTNPRADLPPPADASAQSGDPFANALAQRGLTLAPDVHERVRRFAELLWSWNEKINLTRHTDFDKFVSRDVVDAIHLAPLFAPGERVLDVGTGGGLPGVLLAILRSDVAVSMLDSVEKKAAAVEDMVKQLGLNSPVYRERVQDHLRSHEYGSLVARAVAPLPKLLGWLKPHWGQFRRLLAVKGPAWREECLEAKRRQLTARLDIHRAAEYSIPGSDAMSVVLEVKMRPR